MTRNDTFQCNYQGLAVVACEEAILDSGSPQTFVLPDYQHRVQSQLEQEDRVELGDKMSWEMLGMALIQDQEDMEYFVVDSEDCMEDCVDEAEEDMGQGSQAVAVVDNIVVVEVQEDIQADCVEDIEEDRDCQGQEY